MAFKSMRDSIFKSKFGIMRSGISSPLANGQKAGHVLCWERRFGIKLNGGKMS